MSETETFVKTLCGECWLRVSAYRDDDRSGGPWDFVQIDQVAPHQHSEGIHEWHRGFKNRVRLAWAVLRGKTNPASAWQTFDRIEDFREYIGTLQQAADTAWPDWEKKEG